MFYGDPPAETYDCAFCGRRWERLGIDEDCNCYASFVAASDRPWLDETGHLLNDNGTWRKLISKTRHTARRNHKCGTVMAGDFYIKKTWRIIDDETGNQKLEHAKVVVPTSVIELS